VTVHPLAEIDVRDLRIGDGSIIGPGALIEGNVVHIGREAWLDRYAYIGGGSAFDPGAHLLAGDWLHMGRQSHINIARGVTVGHELGCGVETKVFTHGAYPSELDGFPVHFEGCKIGDRVWLPSAWVNPGVTIGSDVVVAARSLVNRDLPGGCLAGGIPAQVLKENAYPQRMEADKRMKIAERILDEARAIADGQGTTAEAYSGLFEGRTLCIWCGKDELFDLDNRRIAGPVTPLGRILKNQLRRHGIRFRYEEREGYWAEWGGQ
jgi:acetyltransferase-like isoleucine patch superfamily enzyme